MTEKENINTYRYKFSDEFQNHLKEFSNIHRWDSASDFKESWKEWIKEHKNIIELEKNKLIKNGYKGNVLEKMYKSARYYFKNKSDKKSEPKKRRKYIRLDPDLLECMDLHIVRNILDKPEIAFNKFMEIGTAEKYIANEKEKITQFKNEDFDLKIKKTYKNRFYNIIKNME